VCTLFQHPQVPTYGELSFLEKVSHTHVHAHTTQKNKHTHTHTHTPTNANKHTHIHTYTHANTYTHTCVYTQALHEAMVVDDASAANTALNDVLQEAKLVTYFTLFPFTVRTVFYTIRFL
jgi:hypothetical protein